MSARRSRWRTRRVPKWAIGEFFGTFLLVFFGCGSVCAAVATGAQVGIFQVAIVWGIGIATAIYLTGSLSSAHLNPAVTIASAVWSRFPIRLVVPYIGVQMIGAFAAAALLFSIFSGAIAGYEAKHDITRGAAGSEATAMVFADYFPNPGGKALTEEERATMTPGRAFSAELIGTAILVLVIFCATDDRNAARPQILTAATIGLTVTIIISLDRPSHDGRLESRARSGTTPFFLDRRLAQRALYRQRPRLADRLHYRADCRGIVRRRNLPRLLSRGLPFMIALLGYDAVVAALINAGVCSARR